MNYARIEGAEVVEIIISTEGDGPSIEERFHPDFVAMMKPIPPGLPVAQGWTYSGETFSPPALEPEPPTAPAPSEITRRQMLLAMAGAGLITGEEALAAATAGAVPAAMDAVFGGLPLDQALAARITWATMSVAERHHPLITALIDAELATPEQVDAIFIAGAAL